MAADWTRKSADLRVFDQIRRGGRPGNGCFSLIQPLRESRCGDDHRDQREADQI
jgi:hypothetical protein